MKVKKRMGRKKGKCLFKKINHNFLNRGRNQAGTSSSCFSLGSSLFFHLTGTSRKEVGTYLVCKENNINELRGNREAEVGPPRRNKNRTSSLT